MSRHVVVGVGLSSSATAAELAGLVDETLRRAGLSRGDVAVLATRHRFEHDARLGLGVPVVGVDDHELVEASEPPARARGIQSRVAETAAGLVAQRWSAARGGSHAVVGAGRSAHATAAIAIASSSSDELAPEARP